MSTSLQGSEHLALQSFTHNSKAPRGKKCGGIKPTLNVVGGHNSGLAQGVYPGGFDDILCSQSLCSGTAPIYQTDRELAQGHLGDPLMSVYACLDSVSQGHKSK